jgi:hypothetical protein
MTMMRARRHLLLDWYAQAAALSAPMCGRIGENVRQSAYSDEP